MITIHLYSVQFTSINKMEQLQISPQTVRLLCGISFSLTNIIKIDKKCFRAVELQRYSCYCSVQP